MTFFSVLLALALEQMRALPLRNPVAALLQWHAARARQAFDTGKIKHGALAWLAVALPWTLSVGLVYIVLYRIHFMFAFAWNVVIVYFTLGFRQFSHYFTDIHRALSNNDVVHARHVLHQWSGIETTDMPVSEIVHHTLVHAVIAAHRHVFGVFFWFLIPIGPAGAVLYRIAAYLAQVWSAPATASPESEPDWDTARSASSSFFYFARQAFYLIDWLPARLTAFGFAIVGNFEDAMAAWRNSARAWAAPNDDVLRAAGGGALGVQLVVPQAEPSGLAALDADSQPMPTSLLEKCTPRALQWAVGLVWRAVILWMLLLLLLTMAVWLA